MAELTSLIRLHRWQLDEKRRALAELEMLAERLADDAARLEGEMTQERDFAARAERPIPGFGIYLKSMLARRDKLAGSRVQVARQIDAARDEIADAFQELKKFEIAEADRKQRAALRLRRIETITFDEIAITRFHRRASEEGAE